MSFLLFEDLREKKSVAPTKPSGTACLKNKFPQHTQWLGTAALDSGVSGPCAPVWVGTENRRQLESSGLLSYGGHPKVDILRCVIPARSHTFVCAPTSADEPFTCWAAVRLMVLDTSLPKV